MEGFEKIELSSKSAPKESPSFKINTPTNENRWGFLKGRKNLTIIVVVLIVFILSSAFVIVLPAQKVYKSAKVTQAQAIRALDALKKQNIDLSSSELAKTKEDLTVTQKDLDSIGYLRFIPLVNIYYNDAQHLVKAGSSGLFAAEVFLSSLKPYADVLGLKGQGSFVGGTAEQRIETAVKTMDKVTPHIDDIAKYLEDAKTEIDEVDPNHYPVFLGFGKIHRSLASLKTATDRGVTFIEEAKPLIKVLPSLLGEPEEKKYLILFQNDKELRPTGGFITAYSVFRLDKGVIHVDKSDNIYNLDNTIPNKPKAPAPILKYLPRVSVFNLRDTNLSPDFIESMKTFNSFYDKARGKMAVDGIIALNTNVLVSTIKILDDNVSAAGMTFTSKIDQRCDCPQVIYELERSISTPLSLDLRVSDLEAIQAGRKAIIGDLLYAIMTKALKSSPKKYWGPLFQDLVTKINEKHVLFYLYDQGAQQGLHAVNADGKIRSFEGDYLHINESNFSGAKVNLYVRKAVTQNYEVKGNDIVKTVVLEYKNPRPASDCNLERGGLCLNAIYRNWFRIYVPRGSKLIDSRGSEVKITAYEELGKTVYEGFLTVKPQGATTFTISYKLPQDLKKNSALTLLIQKQPGISDEEYSIKINGRKNNSFILKSDQETKVDLK